MSQTSAIVEYTSRESPIILLNFIFKEYGIALIFILFSLIYFKSNKKTILLFSILSMQLVFYLFIINLKLQRYVLELSPFIILLIFIGIKIILDKYEINISTALFLIVVMSVLIPTFGGFEEIVSNAKCTSNGALHQSIGYLDLITAPGDTIVSSVWPYYGYYLNLRVYSPWNDDLNFYIENYDVRFFITSNIGGIPFEIDESYTNIKQINNFVDACGWNITIYEGFLE